MSEKKDGGSAFPVAEHFGQEDEHGYMDCSSRGMSLRDWLAGLAMPAYIQRVFDKHPEMSFADKAKIVAQNSYALADELIKERDE